MTFYFFKRRNAGNGEIIFQQELRCKKWLRVLTPLYLCGVFYTVPKGYTVLRKENNVNGNHLCSSGSHGVKIILLFDFYIKQHLGFYVTFSTGQWSVWHSCWVYVCVRAWFDPLFLTDSGFSVIWSPCSICSQQVFFIIRFPCSLCTPSVSGLFLLTDKPSWMLPRALFPCGFTVAHLVHWKGGLCEPFYSMCSWLAVWAAWKM